MKSKLLTKDRFVIAVGFVTLGGVLIRIINLLRGIIFARLLGPHEFGVFSLCMVALSFISPFSAFKA